MKRLREDRLSLALRSTQGLTRDEKGEFARRLEQCYREECAQVTVQVPDDVWFQVLARLDNNLNSIFLFASVSRDWARRIRAYVRAHCEARITRDWRVMMQFTELKTLKLDYGSRIKDEHLTRMTQLTALTLHGSAITNKGLKPLDQLRCLALHGQSNKATTQIVGAKLHLTALTLDNTSSRLTDGLFARLRHLTALDLTRNNYITDAPLRELRGLRYLGLSYNNKISDHGLKRMRGLTALDLTGNAQITGDALRRMTALTALNLSANPVINAPLTMLTQLQRLWLIENRCVLHDTLSQLTWLRMLALSGAAPINDITVACLTRLETLILPRHRRPGDDALASLCSLRRLVVTTSDRGLLPGTRVYECLPQLETLETTVILPCRIEPIARADGTAVTIKSCNLDAVMREWK